MLLEEEVVTLKLGYKDIQRILHAYWDKYPIKEDKLARYLQGLLYETEWLYSLRPKPPPFPDLA